MNTARNVVATLCGDFCKRSGPSTGPSIGGSKPFSTGTSCITTLPLSVTVANDFAVRLERVWVVTGPVFAGNVKKFASGVEVPSAFYRIILDEENGQPRVLAFIAPQTVTGHEPLTQFLTSVQEIEKQTGLDFYPELPKEVQDRIETPRADRLW